MTIKIKTIIAAFAAAALLATGTFAYSQIVSATNEFMGQHDGVTLHDDYEPGDINKDVYVENSGNVTLYVRVKLEEAMNLTSYTWRPQAADWVTHTYGVTAEDCGHTNDADMLFHDYFTWKMGGWKYYMPASGELAQDTTDYSLYSDAERQAMGIKQTPNAGIISATAFLAMAAADMNAAKSYIGWILDETDGYCYWSQPLKAGQATGLLLDQVITDASLKHTNYYYAIKVILEAVDREDIPMWLDGAESVDGSGKTNDEATDDGKEVIKIIIGEDEDGNANVKIVGDTTIPLGAQGQLSFNVTPADYASGKQINWSSNNAAVVTFTTNADGSITITGESVGSAKISLSIGEGEEEITDNVTVIVIAGPQTPTVIIDGGDETIAVGEEKQLGYTIFPADYDNGKAVVWESGNNNFVTVNNSGKITGIAEGVTSVSVTIGTGAEAVTNTITVTVTDVPVITPASVAINEGNQSIAVEAQTQLTYTVAPAGYDSGKTIGWSSSNPAAATVVANSNGTATVTGVAVGTTTITVTIGAGAEAVTDSITVTVTAKPGGGELPVKSVGPFSSRNNNEMILGDVDFSSYGNGVFSLDEPGVIRLEDVLVNMADAQGLTVAPKDSQYAGYFSIGSAKTFVVSLRPDVPGILYSVPLTYERALPLKGSGSKYPLTVDLVLTAADGRTADIKVTMEYFGAVNWD